MVKGGTRRHGISDRFTNRDCMVSSWFDLYDDIVLTNKERKLKVRKLKEGKDEDEGEFNLGEAKNCLCILDGSPSHMSCCLVSFDTKFVQIICSIGELKGRKSRLRKKVKKKKKEVDEDVGSPLILDGPFRFTIKNLQNFVPTFIVVFRVCCCL